MSLHLNTINIDMHEIARRAHSDFDKGFYLSGGTALALHIGHRKSIDLDYFLQENIDTLRLKKNLEEVFSDKNMEILFEEKNTLWARIDDVNVSFITRKDKLLDDIQDKDVFRLAGLRDIVVMKLLAISSREEHKDYFDIAALSQKTDIRSWSSWWQEVYPNQDMTSWLVALSAVDEITEIPLEISPEFSDQDTRGIIKNVVREITKYLEKTGL